MNIRRRLALRLRIWADRLDHATGPRAFPAHFNFVLGEGLIVTQTDGIPVYPPAPGCPLWYMAEDYERAWEERTA
jgi:hypothetical protein